MPTTYISFTDRGGRFGRIAWDNETGTVLWDPWWPHQKPTPAQIDRLIAEVNRAGRMIAESLAPAATAMAEAFRAFGEAAAKAGETKAVKRR